MQYVESCALGVGAQKRSSARIPGPVPLARNVMTPSLPRSGGQPARFIALGCRLLAFLVIVYQGMRFALDVVGLIRVPSRSQSNPILDGKYYDYVPVASAPLEEVLGFSGSSTCWFGWFLRCSCSSFPTGLDERSRGRDRSEFIQFLKGTFFGDHSP